MAAVVVAVVLAVASVSGAVVAFAAAAVSTLVALGKSALLGRRQGD
jgi:hypothetical protein